MKHNMKFQKNIKYEKEGAKRNDTFDNQYSICFSRRHLIKLTCAWHSCLTQETMTAMMTGHLMEGGGTFLSVDCQESPPPPTPSFPESIRLCGAGQCHAPTGPGGEKAKEGNP